MKKVFGLILLICPLLLLADAQTYRLQSGDYSLTFSPRYKHTVRSLSYQGRELVTPNGFNNLVIGEKQGGYCGAGHKEGGEEEVLSVALSCDGQAVVPEVGQTYAGEKIVVEKVSRLLQTVFRSRWEITPAGILEQKRFAATGGQQFVYFYVFQYCFNRDLSHYLAETANGEQSTGTFSGDFAEASRWHLQSDVRWAAIADATQGKGALLYYPEVIAGTSRRSCFWEVKNIYNKYYLMARQEPVAAGHVSPTYSMFLRGFAHADLAAGCQEAVAAAKAQSYPELLPPEIPGAAVAAAAPVAAPAAVVAAPAAAPALFLADYTRSDTVFDAQVAGGHALAKTLLEEKAGIDFDLMAHSNRGLKVGAGQASLQYESAGNLPVRGSVEMTFSNGWSGDSADVAILLATSAPLAPGLGKLYVYKNGRNGFAAYLEVSAAQNKLFLASAPSLRWAAGEWHHVVLTLDGGKIAFYVDGELARAGELPEAIVSWPRHFTVGPASSAFGRQSTTTIAQLATYAQVKSAEEVAQMAASRLPALKKKLAVPAAGAGAAAGAAATETILAGSPWFASQEKLFMEALADGYVPSPWTPLQVKESEVTVWNRVYDLSGGGVLNQVRSGQQTLLAAPAGIILNGEPVAFGPARVIQAAAGRARLERRAKAGQMEVVLETQAEYDGMLWHTLNIARHGQSLKQLEFFYELPAATADFLHYVGAPTGYESQNLVKNSFARALRRDPGVDFSSGLRTNVWIGNHRGGLLYFVESDQYCYPEDRDDLLTVSREADGRVRATHRWVSAALPDSAPAEVRFQFGLQATPVKPLPRGWRGVTFSAQYDGLQGEQRGSNLIYWPDQWRAISLDPEPTRAEQLEANRNRLQQDLAAGRKIIPYWTRLHYPTRQGDKVNPDGGILEQAWGTLPSRPGGGNSQYDRAALTSGWQDYLVWCTAKWGEIFGHIDGVYIDETQPIPNANPISGGGYTGFSGQRRPTYEALASRALIKRINYGIEQKIGEQAYSMAHMSATHTMQNVGHYRYMLTGEHAFSGYFQGRNPEFLPPAGEEVYYYSYAMPMDRIRAECYHAQWGAVMVWLPCLKNQKEIEENPATTRDMLSRLMQADMLFWPLFCNREEMYAMHRFRAEFGIAEDDVEFIPYWENPPFSSDADGVVVGVYRRGERYLLIVSNLNRETRTVRLHSTVPVRSARNAEDGAELRLESLTIPRNDYRAVRINY